MKRKRLNWKRGRHFAPTMHLASGKAVTVCHPESKGRLVVTPVANEPAPAILVVEDDRGVARALRRALARKGYRVAECHSAQAASGLAAERFAAAVIDLHLPDGCGLALAAALLEAGRIGSVVYFSGSTDRAEIAAAGRSGRFVSKARGADAVLSAVHEIVATQRS